MRAARWPALLGASTAAVIAFLLYRATLVPGMDLGDSAAFQVDAGSTLLTPRQGYPLYFAIAWIAVKLLPGDPAYAANLTSAICGAIAVGVITLFVAGLTRSTIAGVFCGLLFASSYTFWSQSVTAEVYSLHAVCVGLTLIALRAWAEKPNAARLAIAFACYAVSFGNHLSMILLAPAIVLFVAIAHPRGWHGLVERRTLAIALATAIIGAAQYGWNLAGMLAMPDVPPGWDVLRAFWFDVTKTDWRESMVLATPRVMLADRAAMYWFDLRQQFGVFGILLAVGGLVFLRQRRRDLVLVVATYLANWLFAFTYNVGDVHVFFLPSHLMVAVAAGCGVVATRKSMRHVDIRMAAATIALGYIAWRIYDTYPAVDRSADRRAQYVLEDLTENLGTDHAVLAADLTWQLQNGLSYYGAYLKPDLQYFRSADRMLGFPFLVDANLQAGRGVYLTDEARRRVTAAFGPLFAVEQDPSIAVTRVADVAGALPAGTPYALCVLTPYRDRPVDPAVPRHIVEILTGGIGFEPPASGYTTVVGVKGSAPTVTRSSPRPYRMSVDVGSKRLLVRMDAWLDFDTIRRAGFGHVIADHRHALAIDRGISFVAWPDRRGAVVAYESSLYAPQPRFVLHPRRAD